MKQKKRVAIFISGRGSNMEALINATHESNYPAEIICVVSDRENALGLHIAKEKGIPTLVIARKEFANAQEHENVLEKRLEEYQPDIIALAGYMRLLTKNFTEKREGKILNIHPSLLPAFKGLNTHEQILEMGIKIHGCTIHFVTCTMDEGPIIAQAAVPVFLSDTIESLSTRVLSQEHRLYPLCLKWVAEEKVRMENKKAIFTNFEEISKETELVSPVTYDR